MQYKLTKPINFGSEFIDSVDIREEYFAEDIFRIQNAKKKGDGAVMQEMFCIGTNLPAPKCAKISAKDTLKILAMVDNFLDLGEA